MLKKRGQSTLEYAILIVVIIAALLTMQIWIKRGVQGRLRSSADEIGEQFSPGITTGNYTTNTTSYSVENVTNQITSIFTNTTQTKTGNETVGTFDEEYNPLQ